MLPVVVVGHSFVRRLAHYALSIEKMNLNLRENDCAISFIGRGGLTEPKLRGMTAAILARRPAILFIKIGTNVRCKSSAKTACRVSVCICGKPGTSRY